MTTISREQFRVLEGIAYWRAEIAWTVERYGADDVDLPKFHATLESLLDEADRKSIPWAVQNNVLVFAENWRAEKSRYLDCVLIEKGVKVA